MSIPTPQADAEKSLPVEPNVETEISKLVGQELNQIENDSDRLRCSIARSTTSSVDALEVLTSELQQLQEFLKSEVGRVQGEIESVLAGVKIIIEAIAPWKNAEGSRVSPSKGGRGVHAATTANAASAPLPNLKAKP